MKKIPHKFTFAKQFANTQKDTTKPFESTSLLLQETDTTHRRSTCRLDESFLAPGQLRKLRVLVETKAPVDSWWFNVLAGTHKLSETTKKGLRTTTSGLQLEHDKAIEYNHQSHHRGFPGHPGALPNKSGCPQRERNKPLLRRVSTCKGFGNNEGVSETRRKHTTKTVLVKTQTV